MKILYIILFTLLISICLNVNAQDLHFSQIRNTPLLQNPSFAGKADGDIRAVVNHKSQWGNVISNPYQTYGASFDMRFDNKDIFFGGGISIYSDVSGASKMRNTLVNLTASYHVKINKQNYISGGLQAGINQKSIEGNKLRFDNQFDGSGHNAGINSNENLLNITEIKPTVSAGISYMFSNVFGKKTSRSVQEKKTINIGLAVHHFNTPSFHFASQEKLGLKYIANFEGSYKSLTSQWTIKPLALIALQNKASDIVIGSLFEHSIKSASQLAYFRTVIIGIGTYYRFKDALIPTFQLQVDSFAFGFSYDANISELSKASNGKGGFEISLKYVSNNIQNGRKSRARFF